MAWGDKIAGNLVDRDSRSGCKQKYGHRFVLKSLLKGG